VRYRQFIEENFLVDNARTGEYVPFKFNAVQAKYYDILCKEYGEELDFEGVREIVLKARKEGFTSLILALFAAKMILGKHPSRFLEISYKDDATKQHFRRIKNFILSFYQSDPKQWTPALEKQIFRSISEGEELVLASNSASFYVGTASSKTGERGGTVQGVLFSEAAHYPDTGILSASEIIEGTRSMVAVGSGMIFQESTANGQNHYKVTYDMAKRGEVDYRPRFFSWRDFYTEAEFKMICAGFTDKRLIRQEFPENEDEAFLKDSDYVIIPIADVRANVENKQQASFVKRLTVIDVADGEDGEEDGGENDETVIYDLVNTRIVDMEIYKHRDPMDTVGRGMAHAKKNGSSLICVDKIGVGAGVYSRFNEIYNQDRRMKIYGFDSRISAPEGIAYETYANYKAYAWFKAADKFRERQCDIPNDPLLIAQLGGVTYRYRSGKLAVESKKKIRQRLRCSPDRAEAYVMGLDALDDCPQVRNIETGANRNWQGGNYIPERFQEKQRVTTY